MDVKETLVARATSHGKGLTDQQHTAFCARLPALVPGSTVLPATPAHSRVARTHLAVQLLEVGIVLAPHHVCKLVKQRLADAVVPAEACGGRARTGACETWEHCRAACVGGCRSHQQNAQARVGCRRDVGESAVCCGTGGATQRMPTQSPLYPRRQACSPSLRSQQPTFEVVGAQAQADLLPLVDVHAQDAHRADAHLALGRHLAAGRQGKGVSQPRQGAAMKVLHAGALACLAGSAACP